MSSGWHATRSSRTISQCMHWFLAKNGKDSSTTIIFSLKFPLEKCLLANFCYRIFFWQATSENHSDFGSLRVFISSPVILGGLLCASGDTRFLNASEFSSVFGKRICHFLFQFATRSLIYWTPRLSQLFQLWRNWPFPSSKNSHFRNEAKFKTFLVKMKFICMGIKIIFNYQWLYT